MKLDFQFPKQIEVRGGQVWRIWGRISKPQSVEAAIATWDVTAGAFTVKQEGTP
jgi:hypothetical protein